MPIHDWAHTTVPTHVCAQTWLCPHTFDLSPDMILPSHVCAHTRLCPDTFVPTHVCAHTRLCPHTFVPTHVCVQTRLCPDTSVPQHELLWPDTIMSLVNNNIIIVSTRLIMCQLDWWKHKHAQLLLSWHMLLSRAPNMCLSTNYTLVSVLTWLWPCDIITCQCSNVSGHKRVWVQSCWFKYVWAQTCGLP